MKKVLSILGILAIVGLSTAPALAAPGPGGPHSGGPHHGAPIHRNVHHGGKHTPPPPPRMHHSPHHNRGYISVGGVLARPSYWGNYYGCNCRLGWHNHHHHHHYPYYGNGAYINVGIPIRF